MGSQFAVWTHKSTWDILISCREYSRTSYFLLVGAGHLCQEGVHPRLRRTVVGLSACCGMPEQIGANGEPIGSQQEQIGPCTPVATGANRQFNEQFNRQFNCYTRGLPFSVYLFYAIVKNIITQNWSKNVHDQLRPLLRICLPNLPFSF